ncbi:MAG: peptidase MA family metallohydrolase [Ktedonobacteraceae bacterium]
MLLRKCRSLLLVICSLCSLFLFFPVTIPSVYAASSPIAIETHAYRIAFPQYIDFTATALDTSNRITTATLFITFNVTFNGSGEMYDTSSTTERHSVPVATPAQTVSLLWRENTDGSAFYAPGTQVNYYWQLQDSAGNTFMEPQQQFVTVDSRFTWSHLSQGTVQVNWYNQPQNFGTTLLSEATNDITRISHVLGGTPHTLINLWVYGSDGDFHGALPPNTFEWVGGIAYPLLDEATIVATSTADTTMVRDMPHELTHIVFYQLTAQGIDAPTWFNEGLAVYNQLYYEQQMTDRFNLALSSHSLLRLNDLQRGFPADANLAELAYAQSWNLVSYMFKTFGATRMQQLIKDLDNPNTTFDQDLTQAFGMDSVHLENQWRLSLNQSTVLSPVQPKKPAQPQQPVHPQKPQDQTTTDIGPSVAILFGSWLLMISFIGIAVMVFYKNPRRRASLVDHPVA